MVTVGHTEEELSERVTDNVSPITLTYKCILKCNSANGAKH